MQFIQTSDNEYVNLTYVTKVVIHPSDSSINITLQGERLSSVKILKDSEYYYSVLNTIRSLEMLGRERALADGDYRNRLIQLEFKKELQELREELSGR